ncbi:DNA polymerase III subunit alpha [Candidatus Endomicrobiellum trichonymphae]|uniref:DNA polymerase III subunit alpha n=1 Tax=Endomicrobium trichonymphae TaxID=1408204 RepID=B1GZ26_ENDTX|nr:DNA polymerase III subunit alpha [Candidatus Endomicrobium trichonymphae]BAG13508.1 DNA polymerase III subunit alpha [Candidatus Endomicrobium trichonymphae]
MAAEFVHLHNHTEYSLLDGACRLIDDKGKPGELFNLIAKEYKMPALAITDHGNMYGAMEFYLAAKQSGIKPIIGCEIYVAPKSRFDKKNINRITEDNVNYHHLTLLAKDFEGYQNLMRIVSAGFTEGFYYKPRVDKEVLKKYRCGLIALSGCLAGEVASALVKGNKKKAQNAAIEYRDIFDKDNFYIEIMDNGLETQKKIIPSLIELSKSAAIPLVATNDCHFLKKEDAEVHDILLCIGTGKMLNETKRLHFDSDLFYYRSAEDMIKTFSSVPEAIKNTLEIAEKTNLEINTDKLLLPQFPIPKEYKSDSEYLETLCRRGLAARYDTIKPEHEERLKHELSVINKMGFASYFLIVSDFIKYAKDHRIPVGPGRGSGSGAMVAYTLGITDICPLKYGLLFERFLNPDRRSMPDLDIDFADYGRDEVIQYVRRKYGEEKCAQIITFGSMQSRLVIKDVARVMGFTPAESNNIAKLIPQNASIAEALQASTDLSKLVKADEKIAKLIAASQKLEGLKRHTGVHAAGMVIANKEITSYSPLAKGSKDIVTTQYDGGVLPQLGLLKIDFLGLKTLTIIDDCVKFIREKNPSFNLDNIPLDDKKTYELLGEAKTMGIFQLESIGMRDLIKKLKPSNIDDIIALIALYRPGPMGSGMLDNFVNRKHGRTKIVYDHPLQESILKDTYGVILYQEQVMKMSVALAGFTPGEADSLRKAMSKKIPEVIEKQREKFVRGTKEKGVNKKISEKIFNNIVAFGGYGFNKSHSAAYGIISYKTAYLKANYPLEYITALCNNEIGRPATKNNEESKLVAYLGDALAFDIKVLPPDVQYSDGKFKTEDKNIRFGMLAVKNVGKGVTDSIEQSRIENGQLKSFKDWVDFLQRIDLKSINKKALESLIKAGVFDSFGKDKFTIRGRLIQNIDSYADKAAKVKQYRESLQGFLFDNVKTITDDILSLQEVKPLEPLEALNFEKEVLGFYISGHPLTHRKKDIIAYSNYRLDKLPQLKENADRKTVRIAGMIVSVKKLTSTTRKEPYARFKIEDLHGNVNALLFPKNFEKFGGYLTLNNIVVIKGWLTNMQGQLEMITEDIMTIDEAKKKSPSKCDEIRIKFSAASFNVALEEELKKIFKIHTGKTKVYLILEDSLHGNFSIETEYLSDCSDNFINDVETIIGVKDSVELHYTN